MSLQFQMQARSSTNGLLYTWLSATPDFEGAAFPGPGVAQHVAVATRVSSDDGGESTNAISINGNRVPWKATARAAATSNVTKSGSRTVDGVACVTDDRVLLTAQTIATENGLWTVKAGAWARAEDMAASADCVPGSVVAVSEGAVWANTVWSLATQAPITLGATSLVFTPDRALTVASLRLVKGVSDGQIVSPAIYAALKDNGGGEFYWNSSNNNTTRPDNKGTVIVPTSLIGGTGAWERQFHGGTVTVQQFGAAGDWNGTTGTDDTVAIQAAIDYVASIGGGVVLFPQGSGRRWRITDTLLMGSASDPVSRITLRGDHAPRSAAECQIVWDGATGGGTAMLSIRQAERSFVEHLGFNARNKADRCVVWHHDSGDVITIEKSGMRYCGFADARVYNVQVGKDDGALAVDSCYAFSINHCLFCRPTGAHTTSHLRLRSPNAVGNTINTCTFEGDGTYPAYHVSTDSGDWHFHGCSSVDAGTATLNLEGYPAAVPPGVQVYGWDPQDRKWADIDFSASGAAQQYPIIFCGVNQEDIDPTTQTNAALDSITIGTAFGYGGLTIIGCHFGHSVNVLVGAAGFPIDYRNMTFDPLAHGTLKGAGLTNNSGRWNDENVVCRTDLRGVRVWNNMSFEVGANLDVATTHAGFRVSQAIRAGTGANDGSPVDVMAQPGQAQTGLAANNDGGPARIVAGRRGTGGAGAAGADGDVEGWVGDPLSGGLRLLRVTNWLSADTRVQINEGVALDTQLYGASNAGNLAIVGALGAFTHSAWVRLDAPKVELYAGAVRAMVTTNGFTIGTEGAGVATYSLVKRVTSGAQSPGSIAAGGTSQFQITTSGLNANQKCTVGASTGLGAGIVILPPAILSPTVIEVTIMNGSGAPVTPTAGFTVQVDVWQ